MRELKSFKTTLNQNHQYWPPVGAPANLRRAEPWRSQFEDSVNAVSFGFVATAILISMFLVMAIFERLIRTTTTTRSTTNSDSSPGRILPGLDSRVGFSGTASSKPGYQSPKASNFLLPTPKHSKSSLILATFVYTSVWFFFWWNWSFFLESLILCVAWCIFGIKVSRCDGLGKSITLFLYLVLIFYVIVMWSR